MFKLLAVVALLAVGIGAVVYAVAGGTSAAQSAAQYLTAAAARATVTQSVVATGNLAAAEVYGLAFGSAPQVVTASSSTGTGGGNVSWTVKSVASRVGDHVSAGAVVAEADTESAEAALATAKANLQAATDKLATDKAGATETQRQQAAAAVTSARQQLDAAKQNYTDTLKQNDLTLRQARAAVTDAETTLSDDEAAGAPTAQITQDQQLVKQAKQQLSTTTLNAAASKHRAAQSVTQAAQGVTSAKLNLASQTAPATAAQLAADNAQITTAEQAVATAQSTLDGARLTAPVSGTITAVNVRAGTSAPSGFALELTSDDLQVTASFTESDLPSIALGQASSVSVSAAGATIDGTVTAISPTASTTSGSGSVVTYPVTISLQNAPPAAHIGMSVQATITIASAPDVIAVPSVALRGTSGNYSVLVLDDAGQPQAVGVTVGLVSNGLAEISSGLTGGERIVTGTVSNRQGTTGTGNGGIAIPGGLGGGGFVRGGQGGQGGQGGTRNGGTGSGSGRRPAVSGSIWAPPGGQPDDNTPPPTAFAAISGDAPALSPAPTTEPIVELAGISRIYQLGQVQVPALQDVTLTVLRGEFVAIVGASGSGKSTLMNLVGCLDRPTAGVYRLAGVSVSSLRDDTLALVRNRTIGFVFQSYNLLPRTTALENVATPLMYQGVGRRERTRRATAALERLGLGDRLNHEPTELSGGQQQRVAIARAIVTDPALLLADEPTGNLDTHAGADVLAVLHDLHRAGRTIVLITHDAAVASAATRQVRIVDGRIVDGHEDAAA